LLPAAVVSLALLAALAAAGCGEPAGPSPSSDSSSPASMDAVDSFFSDYDEDVVDQVRPQREGAGAWVDSLMSALTMREKIAQLFVIEAGATGANAPVPAASTQAVEEYGVGGFLVSRLLEPEEVYAQTQYLQERANVPLFFAADYERGAGRFANNFTELPSNMAVGATRSERFAAASAKLAALESRALGVNLMFAPVVDVNNNPANPIINIRSYGGRGELVGKMGAAYVRGAQDFGMLTTLKHFPGHGDTGVDTHAEMATVTGSREELDQTELKPYRIILKQKEAQPAAVMGAHLWVKDFNDEPTPATFSEEVLSDLLRDELGFGGLVFTDDVKMGALQNDFSLKERILRPLSIGADVVLTPDDLGTAVDAVAEAVQSGRLDRAELNDSVRRVLETKAQAGLHHRRVPPPEALDYLQQEPRGQALANSIAAASITLLKTTPALPLTDDSRAALVQLSNYEGAKSIDAAMDTLARRLAPAMQDTMRFGKAPTATDEERALRAAAQADAVVLALHLRLATSRGAAGLFEEQRPLVQKLLQQDTPVVLVTLGNPYAADTYSEADGLVVAYDQTIASAQAVAGVLKGEQPAPGRLPITVGPYDFGAGQNRLSE
jgi:beta-N-acetylhexosaminidase